jgi:transcriptional regulator with XRE-family HTH domain
MTMQATGDEQNPAAEQPHPAPEQPLPAAEQPPPAAAPEPALNPLQRLIQQRLRERGWSYREVARRGGLPHSTVHTLAATRNLGRPPRPATIDALAKGLDVPVSVVRAAAAESTGLHYYDEPGGPRNPGDPERELLIASIDELTPDDRRHVAALVESLRNRTGQQPEGSLASRARGGPGHPPGPPRGRFYPIGSPAGTPSCSASSS